MSNTCVCCGVDIPEGRQVCPSCENGERRTRFTPVDEIPEQSHKCSNQNIGDQLRDFMNMNVKMAKMNIDDMSYSHPYSAYTAIRSTISYFGLPINIRFSNGAIYLVRTDMEG